MWLHSEGSLISIPSSLPVYDCLQYANMKEKVLGDLVVCIISDKQRTHRSGDQWKILRPFNVGARAGDHEKEAMLP